MKVSSSQTRAILAAGQYTVVECYEITLPSTGVTSYFTSSDAPVTVGGHTYLTGLTIIRGKFSQKAGLDVQTLDLTISPQNDNPAGDVTIGGYNFLEACRNGTLDAARVTVYKLFADTVGDWSAGLTEWFGGRVNQVSAGRLTAQITVACNLALLNTAMPRNILQTGCLHALYDVGCTLNRATFTFSGAVSSGATRDSFQSTGAAAGQTTGYFDLGRLTITSGLMTGVSRVVKTFVNTAGKFSFMYPLPRTPSPGDTFTVSAGCDKLRSTCVNRFSNEPHFRAMPFVPQPETLYQGGANVGYHRVEPNNVPGSLQGYHIPGIYRG